ncbi:MAG: septal ring lytic transglycosylase RlpA family protein [Methylophilaceae bacterium]
MMKSTRLFLVLSLTLILAACGGTTSVKPSTQPTASTGSKAPPPPIAKKGGGYYLDDGPGDNPPADIDGIPDAVPRAEAPLARANRPYSALGTRYTPMTVYVPYKQTGIASWYGKRYHGQKTSSGELYDMYGMTGAHTVLPLPSYVRVTNPENGRSVIVRINDRGPFHSDRLIDLSYAAAYKLRLIGKGSGLVEVEAIDTRPGKTSSQPTPPIETPLPPVSQPLAESTTAFVNPVPETMPVNGDYVQVGAFKIESNAEGLKDKLRQNNLVGNVSIASWYNTGTYRVLLGPYVNREEADRAAAQIKQVLSTNAIVIRK